MDAYVYFTIDNSTVKSPLAAWNDSGLIRDFLHSEATIPILNVELKTFEKVNEFMIYRQTHECRKIPQPLLNHSLKSIVGNWYYDFVSIDTKDLIALMNAADYLDISDLFDLTCAKVATLIRSKSESEIKKMFNINS